MSGPRSGPIYLLPQLYHQRYEFSVSNLIRQTPPGLANWKITLDPPNPMLGFPDGIYAFVYREPKYYADAYEAASGPKLNNEKILRWISTPGDDYLVAISSAVFPSMKITAPVVDKVSTQI